MRVVARRRVASSRRVASRQRTKKPSSPLSPPSLMVAANAGEDIASVVAATTAACGKDGAPVGQSSNSFECRARVDASRRARGVTRVFLFFPSIANARRRAIASPRPRARSNDTRHRAIPTADRAIRVTAGDRRTHLFDVFHGRDRLGGDGLLRDRGLGDDANAGEGGGKGRHDEFDRFVPESDDARARGGDRPTESRGVRTYVCERDGRVCANVWDVMATKCFYV